MSLYKAVPVVTGKLVDAEGTEVEFKLGDTLKDVVVQGAYVNPIVSGKIVKICLRKLTGRASYAGPVYDSIPVNVGNEDTCKAFSTATDEFDISTVVLETEEGQHVPVAVANIISCTVVASEDAEDNESEPPYGIVLLGGLKDNDEEDPIPDEYLTAEALNYSFKVTSMGDDGTWNIAISATNVPHFKNGNGDDGAWVGVLFVAPEGATSVKRAGFRGGDVSQLPEMTDYSPLDNAPGGKKCIAVYLNKCNPQNQKLAYRLQWDNQEKPTTFVIDITNVTCTDKRPDKEE